MKPEVKGESCNRGWGAEAPSVCVGEGAPLQYGKGAYNIISPPPLQYGGFSSVPVED